eukprot:TRINITY_DN8782_c0_g1_i1.p1 TRINITY_DN8782_c0_g1~~TRINITY_DN8782_c0_g1_i1.p1  ORF type:complete len:348 (-),score=61.49 TRINITY_DN8782_c0_g1_i1:119-1141(-)
MFALPTNNPQIDEFIKEIFESPMFASESISLDQAPVTKKTRKVIKRVSKACLACQKGHLSCDKERPCKKCVEKGKECLDGPGSGKKRGRRSKKDLEPNQDESQNQEEACFDALDDSDTLNSDEKPEEVVDLPNDIVSLLTEVFFQDRPSKRPKSITEEEYVANVQSLYMKREENLRNRIPDLIEKFEPYSKAIAVMSAFMQRKLKGIDMSLELLRQTDQALKDAIKTYEKIGAPVMIWVRGTSIEWVNHAYTDLTGYEASPDKEIPYFDELDNEGLGQSMLAGFKCFINQKNNYTFSCSIRNHRPVGSMFVKGTMSTSLIRAANGIPLIFVSIFLPSNPE